MGSGSWEGDPDLVVRSISADPSVLARGASFTLRAVVRNRGQGAAAATTLRYYRSDDARVSPTDAEVGTDPVAALAPGNDSTASIEIEGSADPGTAYYGACVDGVTGESDTGNNCSDTVAVTVRDAYCRAGGIVAPGGVCGVYGTTHTFEVDANGQGCLRAGFSACSQSGVGHRSDTLTLFASRRDDLSWEIEEVSPAPPD